MLYSVANEILSQSRRGGHPRSSFDLCPYRHTCIPLSHTKMKEKVKEEKKSGGRQLRDTPIIDLCMLTLTQTWPHRDRYTHMSKAGGVGEEDALFKVLTLANHKGESVTCQGDSKQETRKGQECPLPWSERCLEGTCHLKDVPA